MSYDSSLYLHLKYHFIIITILQLFIGAIVSELKVIIYV